MGLDFFSLGFLVEATMRFTVSVVLIFAVMSVVGVFAEVIISDVSALQEGGITAIYGSGFGQKSSPQPWLWDDLSSPAYSGLSDGDPIPTRDGNFGHPQHPMAPYSSADHSGTMGSLSYETSPNSVRVPGRPVYSSTGPGGRVNDIGRPSMDYLFLDFWIYSSNIQSNAPSPPNIGQLNKILRVWSGPNFHPHAGLCRLSMMASQVTYGVGLGNGDNGEAGRRHFGTNLPENLWTHITIWSDGSGDLTPPEHEGLIKIWTDNILRVDEDGYGYDSTFMGDLDSETGGLTFLGALGFENYSGTTLEGGGNYFGDIYIDNTLARVVVGDHPSWSEVSHYEMQIPQRWNSNTIEFIANLGSFNPLEDLFLFVFDSFGNVNSTGFLVSSDGPVLIQSPGQPGQPRINR